MKVQASCAKGIVWMVVPVLGSFLILLPLLFLLNLGASASQGEGSDRASVTGAAQASAQTSTPESADANCATATTVPVQECISLVELYSRTTGTGWTTDTHWLQFGANAPCGWYGVVCNGGHVVRLILPSNRLSGTLPLSIGNLTELTRLRLDNNALIGRIPPTICSLTKLTHLNLAYNGFFTLRNSVEDCLAPLDPDWLATQTNAVTDLRLTDIQSTSLRYEWTPIAYTGDGGYYEIALSDSLNGQYVPHGQTANKSISAYVITGLEPGATYFVRVRSFTPAHGAQTSDVRSLSAQGVGVTQATSGRVLLAAFFPADNDLAPEVPYVIERMRRGTALNPNVQIVLLVDARQDGDTVLLEIDHGQVVTTNVVFDELGVNELDTGDPDILAWFLEFARTTFPSQREVAAIIGHGIAQAPEIEWPELPEATDGEFVRVAGQQIPPLPKEHDFTPSDVTNRSYLSAVDVGKALMEATNDGADPFDVVFFDQCFQGNLDVLYEVRNSARVFVASPNYAWLVAAYNRYLSRFLPTNTPMQLAEGIIEHYEESLDLRHPNAIFWVRNDDLLAIADQVNVLADALTLAVQGNQTAKIANAVQQSKYVDTTQCGQRNLILGPPDELIGIEGFASSLRDQFGAGDPFGVSAAVDQLEPLFANLRKRVIFGNPYLAPTQLWNYGNTLTILAPLPRDVRPDVAWRASIYHDNTPFTATWSVDPTQPVTVTESLAFVRDGRWDEFLDEWYFPLEPTVGQWCQYIPPPQVVVSETEQLSLTVSAPTTDSLQLAWTPTDDTSAVEYWLYDQDPFAISWGLNRAIPLSESTFTFSIFDEGTYHYLLVARNEDEVAIAQSNEISITIDWPEKPKLLMPIVLSD